MLEMLSAVAIVYAIYLGWRLTVASAISWRRSYFPAESGLAEVSFDDLPESAREYLYGVQYELEGLGFRTTGLVHLKFYEEQMGASAYVLQARHEEKPILAGFVWIRFKNCNTLTSPAFSTWFTDNRELLTERGLIGALLGDLSGQDKLVFISEVSVADLLSVHELRLSRRRDTPIPTCEVPLDPVTAQREMIRRMNQLGVDSGAFYRHPERPGYCFTLRSIVRLKWRTSLFIRDLTLARHKRRAKHWLGRVHDAQRPDTS